MIQRDGEGVELQYSPSGLVEVAPDLLALVSTGVLPDGCHACGGALAIHYLRRNGNRFEVLGRWYDLGPGGSFGKAPEWKLRRDLFSNAAVETLVTDGAQGCDGSLGGLYELTVSGPVARAEDINLGVSNAGMDEGFQKPVIEYSAEILPGEKGKSFVVRYTGSTRGDVTYGPIPDRRDSQSFPWFPIQNLKLPDC